MPERPDEKAGKLPYDVAAAAVRAGDTAYLTDDEKDMVGAGGGGWTMAALFLGIFGLGPLGLVAGVYALRQQRTSSWLATVGMLLSGVHTVLLALALVLAVATG
ncbi:hypothetical protein [Oceanitalea stevensii]|uniref:DUF4190 domain-containing protein n=1 Tax=Oceanitalea stevensii TaxID=2763072 RepID=A0ABR8YXX1_9MICO|nr:hypothetical protein [Oceanitalea stevensii]MBD8060927.1 hypothetical protein [Oceanitalea stevensii]